MLKMYPFTCPDTDCNEEGDVEIELEEGEEAEIECDTCGQEFVAKREGEALVIVETFEEDETLDEDESEDESDDDEIDDEIDED